jgi:hypothetical protein
MEVLRRSQATMSELHAAAEAAKRSIERTNYTVREYDLIRMDAVPTKEYQDLRTCRDALLALLNDPASLLKRPEWEPAIRHECCRWWVDEWKSVVGTYQVGWNQCSMDDYHWFIKGQPKAFDCNSLEAAQAACWNDYCERMRGEFVTPP